MRYSALRSLAVLFLCTLFFAAAPVVHAEEEILCPDIDVMKKATPGDLGAVQADIERLNLCVERARLLGQLDSVIEQREQILKKITNPDPLAGGSITTGLGMGVPPLPIGALPPLKNAAGGTAPQDLRPGETRVTPAVGNAFDPLAKPEPKWEIRKIWGQGATMRAQLSDSASGTLLNVIKGDPLPDGSVVESVSVKGVTTSRNGKIKDLSWEQVSSASSSLTGSNAQVVP